MIDITLLDWSALLPFILIGFTAQMVDGALGMAFGVISSTLMVSVMGVPPARASAGVHLVEVFTTAASGISHVLHKNVDWRLFARLVGPGIIGGVLGAYVLISVHGDITRPFVMAYLSGIGFYLLWKSTHQQKPRAPRVIAPLGLAGGFLDAVGGGGWGPVVTSNLLIQGTTPRMTIGTVNTAEFFLTLSISLTFLIGLGWQAFTTATIGLLIGGIAAAPLGAILAKRVEAKLLMRLVGIVLIITSAYSLAKALGYDPLV
jgi:uncharacterized protein